MVRTGRSLERYVDEDRGRGAGCGGWLESPHCLRIDHYISISKYPLSEKQQI